MLGLPLYLAAAIIIGGTMVIAVAGLRATRGIIKRELSEGHNDIAGFIFATVGVVYAVVLGFVVITVWQRFADADRAVTDEAAALVSVFRDTQTFPQPWRDQAQAALRLYASTVPAKEWPTHGVLTVHTTPDPLNAVWNIYREYKPTTPEASDDLSHAKEHLFSLENLRHQRHLSGEGTLPSIFWALLAAGGVVTISFAYFFHMDNGRIQAIMVALLAAGVAALMFSILVLNEPFTRVAHISDYAFQHALQQFNALNLGATVP